MVKNGGGRRFLSSFFGGERMVQAFFTKIPIMSTVGLFFILRLVDAANKSNKFFKTYNLILWAFDRCFSTTDDRAGTELFLHRFSVYIETNPAMKEQQVFIIMRWRALACIVLRKQYLSDSDVGDASVFAASWCEHDPVAWLSSHPL